MVFSWGRILIVLTLSELRSKPWQLPSSQQRWKFQYSYWVSSVSRFRIVCGLNVVKRYVKTSKSVCFLRVLRRNFESLVPPQRTRKEVVPQEMVELLCLLVVRGHSGVGWWQPSRRGKSFSSRGLCVTTRSPRESGSWSARSRASANARICRFQSFFPLVAKL